MATFSEFLDSLSGDEINTWWNSHAPQQAPEKDENKTWKYWLCKNGRKLPFKFAIRNLLDYSGNTVDKFVSDDSTRNQFCEKFDFEIEEDLVFDVTELNTFKDYFTKRISNINLFQRFVEYCHQTILQAGIKPYQIRFGIDANNELIVVISMRMVLAYKEEKDYSIIRLIVDEADYVRIKEKLPIHENYKFSGGESKLLVKLTITDWDKIPNDLFELNKKEVRSYFESTRKSKLVRWNSSAKTTNGVFKKIAFENIQVTNWLSQNQNIEVMEFFTQKDFENISKFPGIKYNNKNSEHSRIYDELAESYKKVEYWADCVQKEIFPVGKTQLVKRPTSQANKFERYQWAKIYPSQTSVPELAYTVGFADDRELHVKIDTVGIGENDKRRKQYYDYRGDWVTSKIVLHLSFDAIEGKGWSFLIEETVLFIKKLQMDFTNLLNIISNNNTKTVSMPNHPLNRILYGPPGTGKTYNTITEAVAIIQNVSINDLKKKEREAVKQQYDELIKSNQIFFTTFHQAMSYEDFIEGIKPNLNRENDDDTTELEYEIQPGLFKIACAYACYNAYLIAEKKKNQQRNYDFEELYESFIEIARQKVVSNDPLICKTINGKDVEIFEVNKHDSIRARSKGSIAKHVAPLTKENIQKLYDKFQSIEQIESLKDVQVTVEVTPRITEFYAVFKALKDFEKNEFKPDIENNTTVRLKPEEVVRKFESGVFTEAASHYAKKADRVVIIIDEINRGNVSSIFGELITLLEEDKRKGEQNELRIFLPYSKKDFFVPPNLYVIGTMNTADRSVEALDTALRRRFSFTEMMPSSELITPSALYCDLLWKYKDVEWEDEDYIEKENALFDLIGASDDLMNRRKSIWELMKKDRVSNNISYFNEFKFTGLNLSDVLNTINSRIELLIDRDHTIGHSFFIGVHSTVKLAAVFNDKIIPLMQEYFFGDYGKIGLVLGKGFVDRRDNKDKRFASFSYEGQTDFLTPTYHLISITENNVVSAIELLLAIEKKGTAQSIAPELNQN